MFHEEEVVAKILQGDPKAFEDLVRQYEKLVLHVTSRLIKKEEDVANVCQEVFIKVYRKLGQFNFQSKLGTWIARIAYLTSINHLRRYSSWIQDCAEYSDHLENYHFSEDTPEKILIEKDFSTLVQLLMAQLPAQYRTVLTLYHLEEFSYQEIGEITGMPEGTIKNYLFRARRLLKGKLDIYLKNE